MITGAQSLDVPAAQDLVFARLADIAAYPSWQSFVTDADVRDTDGEGRATLVEARLDAKVTALKATLRYAYHGAEKVSWTYVDGDLKDMHGSFTLATGAAGAGSTAVTMDVAVDPGFRLGLLLRGPVEGKVRNAVLDGTLRGLAATFTT